MPIIPKESRAMEIPTGVEVSEEVSIQEPPVEPGRVRDTSGNVRVITDFVVREISGPSKKNLIKKLKESSEPWPKKIGESGALYVMNELEGAKKFGNTASPDALSNILADVNNFIFNLVASEKDKKGNSLYVPRKDDMQSDQTIALSIGISELIKGGFIEEKQPLRWARDSLSNNEKQESSPRMGRLMSQAQPEQVDFSEEVSEQIQPVGTI